MHRIHRRPGTLPECTRDQQFDSDPTNQQAALRLNIKWGLAGGGERWGGGGGQARMAGKARKIWNWPTWTGTKGKDRSRRGQRGQGVENVPKKRMSVNFWDAGRRIRWWVLSLSLKTPEACGPRIISVMLTWSKLFPDLRNHLAARHAEVVASGLGSPPACQRGMCNLELSDSETFALSHRACDSLAVSLQATIRLQHDDPLEGPADETPFTYALMLQQFAPSS